MDRIEDLINHVEAAIKGGADADGFGAVGAWVEPFGTSDNVSVFAFSDGFAPLTTGGRHMRVRHWLKERLPPEEARKVVTILALTYDEAKRAPDRLPASGAILDLHSAGD